jgi:hypothetical protein
LTAPAPPITASCSTSGSNLTIDHCVLGNFGGGDGDAILIAPTSGPVDFVITNSTISNSSHDGIAYSPPHGSFSANGIIDHVTATGNGENGIDITTINATGGTVVIAISNSIASNNSPSGSSGGIYMDNGPVTLTVSIDNTSATGNGIGIEANGTTQVLLSRSVITGNGNGVNNATSPNSTPLATTGSN